MADQPPSEESHESNDQPADRSRRRFLKGAAATGVAAGMGGLAAGQETTTTTQGDGTYFPEGPEVGVQVVGEGMTAPTDWEVAPDGVDAIAFVTDQTGEVWRLTQDGIADEPFINISDRMVTLGEGFDGGYEPGLEGYDERGLTGVTFHPNFQENRKFYLHYSAPPQEGTPDGFDHTEILAEFTASEDLSSGDPESETVLLKIPHPQYNHDAGHIAFGPDGYLYMSMGDGGGANDSYLGHVPDWYEANEGGNGQDVTENLLGNFLRIDVDNEGDGKPYAIPEDNPLVDTEGMDEIYAWGFRNPYQWSFNNGELVVGDLGQDLFEEVDIVEKGANYGWNVKEGYHCFSTANPGSPPEQCPSKTPDIEPYNGQDLTDPVVEYPHAYQGSTVGIAIVGGVVSYGDAAPSIGNNYVFGDWTADPTRKKPQGRLFVATPPSDSPIVQGGTTTETGTTEGTATAETTAAETATTESGTETTDGGTETTSGGTETTSGGAETTVPSVPAEQPSIPGEVPRTSEGWEASAVVVSGTDSGNLNYYVRAFGRDANGDVYVLVSRQAIPTGETGAVLKLVSPDQGETLTTSGTQTETGTGTATEETTSGETTTGGETTTSETTTGGETTTSQ